MSLGSRPKFTTDVASSGVFQYKPIWGLCPADCFIFEIYIVVVVVVVVIFAVLVHSSSSSSSSHAP